jgi:rhodanese-related sulfurtransferase
MNPGNHFVSFESKTGNPHYEDVYDIEPQELQKKVNEVKLIDVRQPDEFVGELGHIAMAELMVLDTLPEKLKDIPKDQTVVFICRSGGRSARAAAFALMNGYSHVYNLRGGMLLWNELSLPTQK